MIFLFEIKYQWISFVNYSLIQSNNKENTWYFAYSQKIVFSSHRLTLIVKWKCIFITCLPVAGVWIIVSRNKFYSICVLRSCLSWAWIIVCDWWIFRPMIVNDLLMFLKYKCISFHGHDRISWLKVWIWSTSVIFVFSLADIFYQSLLKWNIIGKERKKDLRSGQIYLQKAACNVDSSHHHHHFQLIFTCLRAFFFFIFNWFGFRSKTDLVSRFISEYQIQRIKEKQVFIQDESRIVSHRGEVFLFTSDGMLYLAIICSSYCLSVTLVLANHVSYYVLRYVKNWNPDFEILFSWIFRMTPTPKVILVQSVLIS